MSDPAEPARQVARRASVRDVTRRERGEMPATCETVMRITQFFIPLGRS
jgi:hypothetical protein